ncbi:MAG: hypothetical protein JWQ55_1700 [Rhodopila sp.]|jgi:hypothetical protein|nr:hypothetical protein [Rhodopila sp.]
MRLLDLGVIGILLPCAAFAQSPASHARQPSPPLPSPPTALHLSYETYAAGLHVAQVDSGFNFGPWNYQMSLAYHTTGMVGFFFRGHQFDHVDGSWRGTHAQPSHFVGQGAWRGLDRLTEIDYPQGNPVIRQLVPPNADEREPVPESLQDHTIDTMSALAELIHVVATTGRCEANVRTYDGRRAVEIEAHTVGEEMLETNSRSSFAGKTLRCDFSGRMLSGFKFGDDRQRDSKPMHGSAWLAPVVAGASPLPVRMAFETRWFGDAIMYLTGVGPGSDVKVANGN